MSSTTTTPNNSTTNTRAPPLHVIFLHLDLGIGGAEQLVLQLASASQALGHQVTLLTTRCDQDHCFQLVKQPNGPLCNNVKVYGRWIPPTLLGVGAALFSNLRVLYLALWLCYQQQTTSSTTPTLVVLDVLPSPLWLLRHLTHSSLLFYCHFPDKLLVRNHNNNNPHKSLYRRLMDAIEEDCMPLADSILVNSKFTQQTVLREFPSLQQYHSQLQVLYPALDTKALDTNDSSSTTITNTNTIVSLNRYERKKKIELVLQAFALLPNKNNTQVIIAGGYDTSNVENVEYRAELEQLAFQQLQLNKQQVFFRTSISDAERTQLLQQATCVVYTPPNEHFGIVPLEVMYAQTPVLACNSGGPLETVKHGETGFLCEPTPESFAEALQKLMDNPKLAKEIGKTGRKHVQDTFGTERLEKEWKQFTEEAYTKGQRRVKERNQGVGMVVRLVVYLMEALLALFLCSLLTVVLRMAGVINAEESILGSMRRRFQSDEL